MWKKLYTTYVRPHLEFAIPVWNPYSTNDIVKLEKIQHRATKIAHSMKGLNYSKRLDILNLFLFYF
jgi:ribonuclease P/MRP protein subunit RPP40